MENWVLTDKRSALRLRSLRPGSGSGTGLSAFSSLLPRVSLSLLTSDLRPLVFCCPLLSVLCPLSSGLFPSFHYSTIPFFYSVSCLLYSVFFFDHYSIIPIFHHSLMLQYSPDMPDPSPGCSWCRRPQSSSLPGNPSGSRSSPNRRKPPPGRSSFLLFRRPFA